MFNFNKNYAKPQERERGGVKGVIRNLGLFKKIRYNGNY